MKTTQEWAEFYDSNYVNRPNYRMKEWRQGCLRTWLERYLANVPSVLGARYLDVGCGRAESVDIATKMGFESRGCEIAISRCERDDVDHLPEGAKRLPYADRQFDVVTCMDVLEHVEPTELDQTIREIWRVCKSAMLIGVPGDRGEGNNPPEHLTLQTKHWWLGALVECMPDADSHRLVEGLPIPAHKQPYWYFEVRR